MQKRAKLGEAKYKTRLQPHNGRDSLWDAIEEAADMLCYLYNEWEEREDLGRINKKILKIRGEAKKPLKFDDNFPAV